MRSVPLMVVVLLAIGCTDGGAAVPQSTPTTTSAPISTTQLAAAATPLVDQTRLPDPFIDDDRFPCGHGSTVEMRACAWSRLGPTQVSIEVRLALFADDDLDDHFAQWQELSSEVCDFSQQSGSIYPQMQTGCTDTALESFEQILGYHDLGTNIPDPKLMWGAPESAFDVNCHERLVGTTAGEATPAHAVIVVDRSVLELATEEFGPVHGNLATTAVLEVGDESFRIEGRTTLWGERVRGRAGGVARTDALFQGEPDVVWAYWWMHLDPVSGAWSGELINIFSPSGRETMTANPQPC